MAVQLSSRRGLDANLVASDFGDQAMITVDNGSMVTAQFAVDAEQAQEVVEFLCEKFGISVIVSCNTTYAIDSVVRRVR